MIFKTHIFNILSVTFMLPLRYLYVTFWGCIES